MTSGGQRREEELQVLTQSPRVGGLIVYTYVMQPPRRPAGPLGLLSELPTQVPAQIFWLQRTETHSSHLNQRVVEGCVWAWAGACELAGPGTGPDECLLSWVGPTTCAWSALLCHRPACHSPVTHGTHCLPSLIPRGLSRPFQHVPCASNGHCPSPALWSSSRAIPGRAIGQGGLCH